MRIILANAVSAAAALFLGLASVEHRVGRMYFFQAAECMALLISQLILSQTSGAISMFFGIIRNLLLSKEKNIWEVRERAQDCRAFIL